MLTRALTLPAVDGDSRPRPRVRDRELEPATRSEDQLIGGPGCQSASGTPSADGTVLEMTRAELHRLIDELPEASLDPAARLLERASDPMVAMLDASPWDDEPYTREEQAAVEAALEEAAPSVPLERAAKELRAE